MLTAFMCHVSDCQNTTTYNDLTLDYQNGDISLFMLPAV